MKNRMKYLDFVGCFGDVNGSELVISIVNESEFEIQPDLMDGIKLLRERYRMEFRRLLDGDELF